MCRIRLARLYKLTCKVGLALTSFLTAALTADEPGGAAWRAPAEASAFSFDSGGRRRVLLERHDGLARPVLPEEVATLYGKPGGFTVFARIRIGGQWSYVDVCSPEYAGAMRLRGPLLPVYQDLSDAAGWPHSHVKPGRLAIDPRHARFKFYEGYTGKISLVRQVPTPHGNPFGLASKGNYLFIGMGESAHGMLVIDAADPRDMKVVADAPRRGPWILDVKASENLAFSSDAGFLNIYDVTDPARPEVLSHFHCGAKYISVHMEDKIVYFHAGDHQLLHRVDIRDPKNPKSLPPWPRKYKAEISCWVVRYGHYAYAWSSAPLQPEEEQKKEIPPDTTAIAPATGDTPGSLETPTPSATPEGETDAEIIEALSDDKQKEQEAKLKALQAERAAASTEKGFYQVTRIYDCSKDLVNPTFLTEMNPGHVILQIQERGGKSYGLGMATAPGIAVYGLEDPARPSLLATHSGIPGSWTLAGDYLYAVAGIPDGKDGGIYVYEFKDILKPPRLVGRLNSFDRRYMEHRSSWDSVHIRDDTLFVTDYFFGVVAIDVSNKSQPQIAGGLHTAGEAFCLDVSDSRVFIGENMGGLTILDNTIPEEARIVGNFGIGGGWGVAAQGNIAFCANLAGLMIVDTTDPKNPVELSYTDGIYNALAVKVQGRYAYCMGNGGYGDIMDISDIRRAVRLGRFQTRRAFNFDVSGDTLYVADHHEGLVIFDISNKKQPQRVATFFRDGGAGSVSIKGNYAFVGAPPGLQIVDISDPRQPMMFAALKSGCGGLVVGDYIYSTSYFGANKLSVTDISDLKNPKFLEGFDPGWYSYSTQCAVHGEYLYLTSLPFLSICRVPMSSEAPKDEVVVECDAAPPREAVCPAIKDQELAAEVASLLPSYSEPARPDPAAVHALLRRLENAKDPAETEAFLALSEVSARLLGVSLRLVVPDPLVPGFSSKAVVALSNRGPNEVLFQAPSLTSSHPHVQVQPVDQDKELRLMPGQTSQWAFLIQLSGKIEADERLPLSGSWAYAFSQSTARFSREWLLRATELVSVTERIPRLEVSNLAPVTFSFSVTNNTTENQEVTAQLGLPNGWLAEPEPQQALSIPGAESREFRFSLRLPDAEALLGLAQFPLRVTAREKRLYEKAIDALAARQMRWRILGPFGFDVTSEERPIPEKEVDFEKSYEQGGGRWRVYVCHEDAAIDLCQPPGQINSGSVLLYYGATFIHSDRSQEVKFVVSGDPSILSGPKEIRGWLHGSHAFGSTLDRPTFEGVDLAAELAVGEDRGPSLQVEGELDAPKPKPLRLEKGWNLLLIRTCWINNHRFIGYWITVTPQWPFRLALQDLQGNPIRNLTFDSERSPK